MLIPNSLWSLRDMLSLPIDKLLTAYSQLRTFHQATMGIDSVHVTPDSYNDLKRWCDDLLTACTSIGLQVTKQAVSDFSGELKCAETIDGNFGFRGDSLLRLKRFLEAVITCMGYESSLKAALILSPEKSSYYESASPLFGTAVHAQFPSATFEIEEAGKCLAVGRDTAAVFHLMRVMEVGIHAITKCLGIPDPVKNSGKNWGIILKNIQANRVARCNETPKNWVKPIDEAYFESAQATLDAVKNAWRNTTMHVENKYTSEEAELIFHAVRGFMMKLVSRMDEQGLPLA